jgi:uncharacterized membrane protein (UPF0127 family)
MRYLRAVNSDRNAVLGHRIGVADRWWLRLRGLVGRTTLAGDAELDGLLLEPCSGIHMYGMGFAIDVVFLDADDRVVALHRNLMPGAQSLRHPAARRVLELPAGMLRRTGTREGDRIVCTSAAPAGAEASMSTIRVTPSRGVTGRETAPHPTDTVGAGGES